jgi:nickel-dependent lactate racemase
MRIAIGYGREVLELEMPEARVASVRRAPPAPPLSDPVAAVRDALETPHDFPALRRALTPDDHVAVIVDEQLPRLGQLLLPVLEHLAQAHVGPEAITLLCAPHGRQQWVEELPDQFEDVRIEVHDPSDRRRHAYLATTKHGRRVYLNRTAVDADQLVVLTGRGYDPLLGYSGAAGAIYPALSDEATRRETGGRLSLTVPGPVPWPIRQEAAEVAWLLGAPFLVQVIAGSGEDIVHVVAGSMDSATEGQRLLDARWRVQLDEPVPTVILGLAGDPARHGFGELAQALACAARVVEEGGRIVLLTQAMPPLTAGAEMLREAGNPAKALDALRQQAPPDLAAGFQWASAAQKAQIYLLSNLPADVVEELFATPLDKASQVERLVGTGRACLFLADGHKTMAEVKAEK